MAILRKIFPSTVKYKVLLSLVLIMLLLIAVPSVQIYRSFLSNTIEHVSDRGQEVYASIEQTLESRGQAMDMLATMVANNNQIRMQFSMQDQGNLLIETLPLFEIFKKKYNVNVFHFHTPPATSFLRVHKPEKFGDDLSSFRFTVVKANQTKQEVVGLEQGKYGLSSRAVIPIKVDGEHLGTVEVGIPLDDALLIQLKKVYHTDISLIGRDSDGFKYIAKTHNMEIPRAQFPFLESLFKKEEIVAKQVNKNGKNLVVTYGPIRDAEGNITAILAVPLDIGKDMAHAKKTVLTIIGTCLVIFLAALLLVYFLINSQVNKPINNMISHMQRASSGDLQGSMALEGKSGQNSKNEFDQLNSYFATLLGAMVQLVQSIKQNSENLNTQSDSLTAVSDEMANVSTETAERSGAVASAAEEMSSNMNSVAAATEEAAANVNVMTTATEEIRVTVDGIQENTNQAKTITSQAVGQAHDISVKVDELGTAALDIGKVTETITEISEQTNLLALNATIEAARAGEAGKGFAVVANEIKDLAKQTAEATGNIKSRIDGIQSSTDVTVNGIKEITSIISEIDSIVSSIATALEEQSGTMHELTTNIQQAGEGISEVSENVAQTSSVSQEIARDIAQVYSATSEISNSGDQVKQEAVALHKLAQQLRDHVAKFTV